MPVQLTSDLGSSSESFQQEVGQVVGRLRAALMEVLQVAGEIKRSRDVQDRLGLNVTLSWHLYRILNITENIIEICPHIPSAGMMQKLLTAAAREGASKESMTALAEAHARFEAMVESYAGDREAFNAIASRLMGREAQAQIEVVHRQAAFECERHVWGLDLQLLVSGEIFGPLVPGQPDQSVMVSLKRGLRRLSFDQNFAIGKASVKKAGVDQFEKHPHTRPLNSAAFEKHGINILPTFCSTLDVPLKQFQTGDTIVTEWVGESLGKPSSVDIATGDININTTSDLEIRRGESIRYVRATTFGIPTRQRFYDIVVHRPTRGSLSATISRWGHSMDRPTQLYPLEAMGLPRLPCHDRFALVGTGRDAVYLADAPQYSKMVQYACDTMGWNLAEMDIYRVCFDFPLMHTLNATVLDFPPRPPVGEPPTDSR